MDPDLLRSLKTLADLPRLRILGLLAGGPMTHDDLARSLDLGAPAVGRHVERLRRAGLVVTSPAGARGQVSLVPDRLAEIGRDLDALERSSGPALTAGAAEGAARPPDPAVARSLRGYLKGDRLVAIPARSGKRLVVLQWLAGRCFAEDREYPEREVNALLARHHEDVAALRRYLVDEGIMTRQAGIYRRAPG